MRWKGWIVTDVGAVMLARRQVEECARLWLRHAEEVAPTLSAADGNDIAANAVVRRRDAALFVGVATAGAPVNIWRPGWSDAPPSASLPQAERRDSKRSRNQNASRAGISLNRSPIVALFATVHEAIAARAHRSTAGDVFSVRKAPVGDLTVDPIALSDERSASGPTSIPAGHSEML
jgi:hypothetical protein